MLRNKREEIFGAMTGPMGAGSIYIYREMAGDGGENKPWSFSVTVEDVVLRGGKLVATWQKMGSANDSESFDLAIEEDLEHLKAEMYRLFKGKNLESFEKTLKVKIEEVLNRR